MARKRIPDGQLGLFNQTQGSPNLKVCQFCKGEFHPSKPTRQFCSDFCRQSAVKTSLKVVKQIRQLRTLGKSFAQVDQELDISAGTAYRYGNGIGKTNAKASRRVKSPDGKIYEIPYRGLAAFCREHKLTYKCIDDLFKGKQRHHQGWMAVRLLEPSGQTKGRRRKLRGL